MNEKTGLTGAILKPTLLLDQTKATGNIHKMLNKAQQSDVLLRPHFKTHQSAHIGEWFREHGIAAITVSSVDMAHYFADAGWKDITIAFPVNLRQMGEINELAQKIRLNLLVESAATARRLSQDLQAAVNVWLKIDAGYQRTGIAWNDTESIIDVAQTIVASPRLSFKGVLTHAGHTYNAKSRSEVVTIYQDVLSRLKRIQISLQEIGLDAAISVGDTPGCSLVDSFGDVDEVRPGNFVFYDLAQFHIGSCTAEEIAVAVACPVVARHESRQQLVLYGGAIHLSKEYLTLEDARTIYGRIALPTRSGWTPMIEDTYLISLSQEHGIVQASKALFDQTKVGDLLLVIPVHSCLTANLFRQYLLLNGESVEIATLQ